MNALKAIKSTLKIAVWTVFGIVCFLAAILALIYSPWSQEIARQYLVAAMADGDMKIDISRLRIGFPLDIEADGVRLRMSGTDIAADKLQADVRLLPLLAGRAKLDNAQLDRAKIVLGSPDSAMYMTLESRQICLQQATVGLADMHIDVADGAMNGTRVAMFLSPDTTAKTDTAPPDPTKMRIHIDRMKLDDFNYSMRMLPTIDSLGTHIACGELRRGRIDLEKQTIDLESFIGNRLAATYIVPDSATIAATPVVPPSESQSAPWTIKIDSIAFDQSSALYTTRGISPLPGLDFGYISADSLSLQISDFYNQASTLRVPLSATCRERCGVELRASGILDIDDNGLKFSDFKVETPNKTDLTFSGLLGMGDMMADPDVPLRLDLYGYLAPADLRLMFPAATPVLIAIPDENRIYAKADIDGTAGNLNLNTVETHLNGVVKFRANGHIANAFAPDRLDGHISLDGSLIDLNPFKKVLFDKATAAQISLPRTSFDGKVDMNNGRIVGRLTALTHQGRVSLDADWRGRTEDYAIDLSADRFPIDAFMPLLGVGELTADLSADGHGYNPFSAKTRLSARLSVDRAVYRNYDYRGVSGTAELADGIAELQLRSTNPNAKFDLDAHGNLAGDQYQWTASLDGVYVDLQALGMSPDKAQMQAKFEADAFIVPASKRIEAQLRLNSLDYTTQIGSTRLSDVLASLNATDSTTNLTLHNRDLHAEAHSPSPLDSIMARVSNATVLLDTLTARREIAVEQFQQALPPFTFELNSGGDNLLGDLLSESRSSFKNLHLAAANDSTFTLDGRLLGYATPTMKVDTLTFDIAQFGPRLDFKGRMDNRPGSFDEWAHARVDGFLENNGLGITLRQANIKGQEGYSLGLRAELADSLVSVSVEPTNPTIAYKPWTVNADNFISYSFAHKHIDANLHMNGIGSAIAIYTDHVEGHDEHQEEIVVDLSNIKVADWVKINPFAPPMSGNLSADMRLNRDQHDIMGRGNITLTDFIYDRQRVGTIRSDIDVSTDLGGRVRANADISIDNVKTITLAGALNDSVADSPLALDLSMIRFPLRTLNPFLPSNMAKLSGTLNGQMDITGTASTPGISGWVQFDSTEVKVDMLGASYAISPVRIPVEGNVVKFHDFGINGVNGSPLAINGTVDIRSLASPAIDLRLTADNFQICNTNRARGGAEIYGRGFISTNTSIRGNMDFMAINADLSVLPGTNITYIMTDAESVIASQSTGEMVKFVNFSDTAAVAAPDETPTSALAMLIEASLNIRSGSTVNVDLSSNGRDKVSLRPEGSLDFTMQPFAEPRITGRINVNSGFARYTPPVIGEKLFNFKENSYVAFTGDMMNPTLNIQAVDVVKANVTQNGQNSRLVDFDVSLAVTGTLANMNVVFDLATDDDITVANELQSMSAEQRANQAMNMLLYNVYTGPGTSGDGNLSGNALYTFLTSQLNSWAARTIKGVDLSFGIDQYDRTLNGSTSSTTSYSYQVSKSLFNDRFKIVVGGNYSTDANADENFSQNLIKDISFEYFINSAQTMYVRLFRHTGYESILEGEITKTGVGFVFKRKLTTLRNIFRFRRATPPPPKSAENADR